MYGYVCSSVSSLLKGSVDKKWKLSLTVSALITVCGSSLFVHEITSWQLAIIQQHTVTLLDFNSSLMCVEFYLLTRLAGATKTLLWKLIVASTWMLVAGYIGEAFSDGSTSHSVTWGMLSTIGYYMYYTLHGLERLQLAANSKSAVIEGC